MECKKKNSRETIEKDELKKYTRDREKKEVERERERERDSKKEKCFDKLSLDCSIFATWILKISSESVAKFD